jgi:hypothetical protein
MTEINIEETTEFIQSKILKECPLEFKTVFFIFCKKYVEDYSEITRKIKQLSLEKNIKNFKFVNYGLCLFSHILISSFLITNNPKISIYLADKSIKLYYEYLKFHLESKLLTYNDIKLRIYESLIGKNQIIEFSKEKEIMLNCFKLFQNILKYFDINDEINRNELCNQLCNIIYKLIEEGYTIDYVENIIENSNNQYTLITKNNMFSIKNILFIKAYLYLIFNNQSLNNIIENQSKIISIINKNGENFKNSDDFINLYNISHL